MKNKFLLTIAIGLAAFGIVFSIIVMGKSASDTPETNILRWSYILIALSLGVFIISSLFEVVDKKDFALVPLIILIVMVSYINSNGGSIGGSTILPEVVQSVGVLSLLITALLFVSLVFACKKKKWASIIIIVYMSLMAYSAFVTFDTENYEFGLNLLFIYSALIVYFSRNLISTKEKSVVSPDENQVEKK